MKKLVFSLIFFASLFAQADNIYVAPVQGTGVNEQELMTLRELIKVQVQNESKHRLVDSLKEANFYIQTKLIKFNQYTLSMTRWKGNESISSGQWKAKDSADLENQMGIAVKEILTTNSNRKQAVLFENEKSLGEQVEEKKQHHSNERLEARRQVILGFGPAFYSHMNSEKTALSFQAGYVWSIDDHFDLGLKSDFAISTEQTDAYLLSGKIFTNYFFSSNDISPFIGAGFGYGWASVHDSDTNRISDDSAGGFTMGLQAGVKFFRTSSVNLGLAGEYTQIFDNSSLGNPRMFTINVALYY